eukprot:3308109-Lingulodinium_polyedra.AAC.1
MGPVRTYSKAYMQPVRTCSRCVHAASAYRQPVRTCSQCVHAASVYIQDVGLCGVLEGEGREGPRCAPSRSRPL